MKLKVLSLFDGISCGRIALERAGFEVERYVAYEIDKYAIQISKKNYPDIEHMGDVTTADFTQYKGFDLLIGGSPCTYWSIAKKDRETTSEGIGFELFMHYVRAWKESGCKWFLYENNYSIHPDIKAEITKQFGIDEVVINSALVSAQNRMRCYWTNIPNVTQPQDKGILLKDVLESGASWQNKSYCMTSSYDGAVLWNTLERGQKSMVAEPIAVNATASGKAQCLRATYYKDGIRNMVGNNVDKRTCVAEPICVQEQLLGRKANEDGSYTRVLEPRKDGKSGTLTNINRQNSVAEPIRIGAVEHGGNQNSDSKQWRVYSVKGKSVTICGQGDGAGAKTRLYKIDLPDGDYIIRKLTPIETERLQTLPDNYTEGISNTQRYKCIGNGWTVDVIAHILQGIHEGYALKTENRQFGRGQDGQFTFDDLLA